MLTPAVQWKALGEIGAIFGGLTGKTRADFTNGNAHFVPYINVFDNISVDMNSLNMVRIEEGERQKKLLRGDVLLTGSSETLDEVAMSSVVTTNPKEPLYLNSFTIGLRFTDPRLLNPEFTKYLFRSSTIRKQLISTASGVTRFNVSKARLSKVTIPIPSLKAQDEIARILDKFDALTTSLSEGIPAEITARRKQYEHYRNQLLTFSCKAAV